MRVARRKQVGQHLTCPCMVIRLIAAQELSDRFVLRGYPEELVREGARLRGKPLGSEQGLAKRPMEDVPANGALIDVKVRRGSLREAEEREDHAGIRIPYAAEPRTKSKVALGCSVVDGESVCVERI